MIVYGVCAGPSGRFERIAEPSITAVLQDGDKILALRDQPSIAVAYNSLLDFALEQSGLEALVLLHDDVEIRDPDFRTNVVAQLSDPTVGILGVVGGRHLSSLKWWDAEEVFGYTSDAARIYDFSRGRQDVDSLDGILLALSPNVLSKIRFDEQYRGFHGYDADICFQVRSLGFRAVVSDLAIHHHGGGALSSDSTWSRADFRFRSKWLDPQMGIRPGYRLKERALSEARVLKARWTLRLHASSLSRLSRTA